MRVYELAKELGIDSKQCLAKLGELGIQAKNHMSAVDASAVELLREAHAAPAQASAAAPAPKAAPEPPVTPLAAQGAIPPDVADALVELEDDRPIRKPTPAKKGKPVRAGSLAAAGPEEAKPLSEIAVEDKVMRVRGAVLVKELAEALGMRPNQLITELMGMNVLASITQRVDINVARAVAEKHGFQLEHEKRAAEYQQVQKKSLVEEEETPDRPEDLLPRPPVVTFLGHVDHGKTSLLDRVRDSAVVNGEHGGITQHIGAYTVDVGGRSITFLDTPGHAAFTAMRARGANLTDIAVIVIAADDGIMPQTREAIMHARAAEVSLLVAINKMDLPAANLDRVKMQLQAEGLAPEDWGGETICCPVSAQTGEGIDHLLEMILLQADVLELKANPERRAGGFVVEAQLEPGMGPVATLLVTKGTLRIGDAIVCGRLCGKVRALINDHGLKIKTAKPSTPVKCLGLAGVPEAGAEFKVYANDKAARLAAQTRSDGMKADAAVAPRKTSLDDLFQQMADHKRIELKVILKADTQGSIEAIAHSLSEIKSDKISLRIILAATGNITVNDVMLASASDAVILGFHVSREPGVDSARRHEGVDIRAHHIIYELLDQVREAMTGMLSPELRETVVARAEVKQVFGLGKTSKVAGCLMTQGTATMKCRARVRRGEETLHEGRIATIKHFQTVVSEIREAQECGILLEGFSDFAEGDVLEFYQVDQIKQTL